MKFKMYELDNELELGDEFGGTLSPGTYISFPPSGSSSNILMVRRNSSRFEFGVDVFIVAESNLIKFNFVKELDK